MMKWFGSSKSKKERIYLDYASATPILPEAALVVANAQGTFGNPGSIHAEGVAAARSLKDSRERIAREIGAKAREIIFVSGGTEANNLAILGFARAIEFGKIQSSELNGSQAPSFVSSSGISPISQTHWIVSSIEHPSVLECFGEVERLGGKVDFVDPDANGIIRPDAVARLLRTETIFVSIGWGNSEIGVVQPLGHIARVLRAHEKTHDSTILFHSDAGQTPLYDAANVHSLGVDLLTLDSGKLYGPRGIGCLYVDQEVTLAPIQLGGNQERGLRAGTENVALAAGFAEAFSIIGRERTAESKRLRALRDDLASQIVAQLPGTIINGSTSLTTGGNPARSMPHILNISIPDISSEYITLALDHAGIAISTKSACREGDAKESHVVKILASAAEVSTKEVQVSQWRSRNTLRFSFGRDSHTNDNKRIVDTLVKVIAEYRTRS